MPESNPRSIFEATSDLRWPGWFLSSSSQLKLLYEVLLNYWSWLLSKADLTSEYLLHEHFQVKRPLIKYWRHLTIKGKTSNMKSESDDVELQQKSSKLSPSQPGPLVHFPFHSAINSQCLPHWTKRPGSQIKCLLRNWKLSILLASLEKNILTPLTPPTPPGLRLPGLFTSPPPPLVIRKQKGGGTSILIP